MRTEKPSGPPSPRRQELLSADYRSDFGYHAQMEPLNAVARLNDAGDRIEVWDGSQSPDRCREEIAEAMGFGLDQVTVHQCYMGGAFGRRSIGDYAVEAALVAREVGKPVKLIWTREEDIAFGMFRPQSFQCLEAALDDDGKVVGWRHCVVGDGDSLLTTGIKIPYYEVPNQHIERRGISHGMRLKHWRAVGHVFNVFAIESFVDELAAQARNGSDRVPARADVDHAARAPGVRDGGGHVRLDRATARRPDGRRFDHRAVRLARCRRRRDLARPRERQAPRAQGLDRRRRRPDRAARRGQGEHRERHRAWPLECATERVTVSGGVVEQSNFHDYTVLRMSEAPEELHIAFVDSGAPPSGLGEIGNPFAGAAVANAFFALTGKRLRHMPFTRERVLEALQA